MKTDSSAHVSIRDEIGMIHYYKYSNGSEKLQKSGKMPPKTKCLEFTK